MRTNYRKSYILSALLVMMTLLVASCSDWTQTQSLEYGIERPETQDPELWAKYTGALKDYKASGHFISYAVFDNAPQSPSSEKDFLRCLPDSLDIVSLTNADNLSKYDIEDLKVLHEKGTKVIYRIDYSVRGNEFTDAAALDRYLDEVIAAVETYSLDGFSFTGNPGGDLAADASASIVSKLSAVVGPGKSKLLAFEGDPAFITEADRDKVDFFVLDTKDIDNVTDLKMNVIYATDFLSIPHSKILLAAQTEFAIFDEDKVEYPALTEVANRVAALGPVGGFAVYGTGKDYFGSDMNYKLVRSAIQVLNPAK